MTNPPVKHGDRIIAVKVPYLPRLNGQEVVVIRGEPNPDGDIFTKLADGTHHYVREWSLVTPPTNPQVRPGQKVRGRLEFEGYVSDCPVGPRIMVPTVPGAGHSVLWLDTPGLTFELVAPEFKPGDRIELTDGRYAIYVPRGLHSQPWYCYRVNDPLGAKGDWAELADLDAIGWERA